MTATINNLLGQAVSGMKVRPTRVKLRLTTDSCSIDDLKRWFLKFANEEVAGFRVTADNRRTIADIFNWCIGISGELDPGKGLWLYGNIGTGKTSMLRIVKSFCREVRGAKADGKPYSFAIVRISDVVTAFSGKSHKGVNEYADNPSIAYDDVGTETISSNHYGNTENLMQYILQRRYGRDYITHATSNISPEGIRKAYGDRVYDRCREMFNFVEMKGKSFRK